MPPHRRNDPPAQGNPPAGNNPPANNPPANNPPANLPTIALIRTKESPAVNRLPGGRDFTGCVDGTFLRVAPEQDGIGARNWVKNDSWAQQVIMDNVSTTQMNHICP